MSKFLLQTRVAISAIIFSYSLARAAVKLVTHTIQITPIMKTD